EPRKWAGTSSWPGPGGRTREETAMFQLVRPPFSTGSNWKTVPEGISLEERLEFAGMAGMKPMTRDWLMRLDSPEARIRCGYKRHGKYILQFMVQLEILHEGTWQAVVRYDNAHGFCHRDTLHPDGTQDKTTL